MANPGFSLGYAICGQAGHAQTPDAWRSQLLHDYLDAKARLAWFRSCRAGRDWVLEAAAQAQLTLHLDVSTEQLMCTLAAARTALQTRGGHGCTSLAVTRVRSNASHLVLVPEWAAGGPGQNITSLHVDLPVELPSATSTAFLTAAATALSNLQALHVTGLSCPLPPPAQLPHLTDLHATVRGADAAHRQAVLASIGRYLKQLIVLTLNGARALQWQHVFSDTTGPTQTLKQFSTDALLTSDLLELLLLCTPVLEQLGIAGIADSVAVGPDESDEGQESEQPGLPPPWRSRVWGVTTVRLGTVRGRSVGATHMACLPSSATGCTTFVLEALGVQAQGVQGLSAAVLGRLPTWQLQGLKQISMYLRSVPAAEQPAAITAACSKLSALDAAGLLVLCKDHSNTPAVYQALNSATAQHMPLSSVGMHHTLLRDTVVDTIIEHAPRLTHVEVIFLQLTQDHSTQACNWSHIEITHGSTNIRSLFYLPSFNAAQHRPVILNNSAVWVDTDFAQEEAEDILARPQAVHFQTGGLGSHMYIQCPQHSLVPGQPAELIPVDQQPAVLRTQLEVCRSMRVFGCENRTCPTTFYIRGYTLTPAVIAELGDLPQWGRALGLTNAQSTQRAAVSAAVPTSYTLLLRHD